MKVTLADIAKEAGVSQATVSYALNRRGNISKAKREEILAIAARHKYKPAKRKRAARRTRSGMKHGVVAVLFPHSVGGDLRASWGNEYVNSILAGAQHALSGTNTSLTIVGMEEPGQLPEQIRDGRVDGVIAAAFQQSVPHFPVPAVVAFAPLQSNSLDLAVCDHEASGTAAAKQLLKAGCRKCAFVSPFSFHPGFALRRRAFLETLQQAGADALVMEVNNGSNPSRMAELMQMVLDQRDELDGIFIPGSDKHVLTIAMELQKHTGTPLGGLEVVSCLSCIELLGPMGLGISYIDVQTQDVGSAAVDALLRRIKDPNAPLRKIMVQPRLLD